MVMVFGWDSGLWFGSSCPGFRWEKPGAKSNCYFLDAFFDSGLISNIAAYVVGATLGTPTN